jgi:hypothetical protein
MGVKYVKDFSFPTTGGFHGDVQRYAKGGHVTKVPAKAKASAKDVPARAKPNAPAKGAPKMASKPATGKRQGYNEGGRVPGYEMDRLPTKRPPGRGMDLAPARRFKGDYQGYAEGGPVDEILPGDGRGGLEMAMPTKQVKRYSDEYDLPPLLPETPNLTTMPVNPRYDILPLPPEEPPVGTLKPLPEEPQYLVPEEPVPYREVRSGPRMERWSDGTYNYLPEHTGQRTPLGSLPDHYRRLNQEVFKAERGANRREMVGARGARRVAGEQMARPIAAPRAPTPRMGIPKMPEISPFDPSVRAGYWDREIPVFKKGGEVKGKKIAKVMGEYKRGELRSGSKKGPKVTNPKQAMAIALSEAGAKKKAMGGIFNDENMAYESKGPKTRYSAARSRRVSKERAMERRALDKARHAEMHAPGKSLDMADKKSKGGMPVHRRKPMYGGGKC